MSDRKPFVVVTGAASGIGAAVARRLLRAGTDVLGVDVDAGGMQPLEELGATTLRADLSGVQGRQEVTEAARGCTGLVNAAGIIVLKPLLDVTVEDWRRVMAVNAESIFFLCQQLGPTMPPGSAIVNLSSSSAKLATTVEVAAYAASKTTILSITRSFAYQFADVPVRVNAVCPGIIETPMQDAVLERVSRMRDVDVEQLSRDRNANVPMGRAASPDELAGLIDFLLGEDSSYMTGQAINFTGGLVNW